MVTYLETPVSGEVTVLLDFPIETGIFWSVSELLYLRVLKKIFQNLQTID